MERTEILTNESKLSTPFFIGHTHVNNSIVTYEVKLACHCGGTTGVFDASFNPPSFHTTLNADRFDCDLEPG